ncbi:MAG: hypothetical protein ABJO36_04245 [Litorimonas sp.]
MLYLDNRPLNPSRRHAANGPDRFYQWRGFFDDNSELDDIVQLIEKEFSEHGESDHQDKYFLLPGRSNTITTLCDNETLEVHTMISAQGPLEQWERSVKTTFPMKRTTASIIGTYVPKFRGSCSSVADAESLTDALSKKSRYYEANLNRRHYERNSVSVEIETIDVGGKKKISISLRGEDPSALMGEVEALGLKGSDNTHFGAYLNDL